MHPVRDPCVWVGAESRGCGRCDGNAYVHRVTLPSSRLHQQLSSEVQRYLLRLDARSKLDAVSYSIATVEREHAIHDRTSLTHSPGTDIRRNNER